MQRLYAFGNRRRRIVHVLKRAVVTVKHVKQRKDYFTLAASRRP